MSRGWFEDAFGAHYPELYAHRDDDEAQHCLDLLPRLAPLSAQGRPVLDLGCGDGRHLVQLSAQGTPCLGLDLSRPLLRQAQLRSATLPLVQGDMRTLPFPSQSLDSILNLFTAFGYFGPLADNKPVLAEVARCLAPQGHWFLDYLDCDKVRMEIKKDPVRRREYCLNGASVVDIRRLSPDGQRVCKDVAMTFSNERSPLNYTEEVALFSLAEIDSLAASLGLTRINEAGSYTGVALGSGDRWILVYRKDAS